MHRTGCAVRRGGWREDFHTAPRTQGLLQLKARPARALAPTVEALPLMVTWGRGAALDIARRAGVRAGRRGPHVRNEAPQHLDDQLQTAAETPRRYRPAPRPVRARVRCRCRRPPRRSCRDRAGSRPGALSIGFATWSFMPAASRLRGRPARRWRSWPWIGSPAKRSVGADSPGRLETIDIRHLHVHQHRVERHARLQHLLNAASPPSARATGRPSLLNSSAATCGVQRVVLHYQQTHAPQPLVRPPGAAAVGWAPCSPCNACSTESPVAWA